MSASETQIGKELYEFGSFRVDPAKQLLLHDGEPVPLTPKAFQLLLVLVRHCNEIVTKDELMKAVWPETFVEETNLSRNIFALRKALAETEQNRFIITVPGRGYRFSEHVRLISEPELTIVAASHSKLQVQVRETKPWTWILLAAAIVLVIAAGAARFLLPRHAVLTERDTVVLADFANSTGDPVFDGTLRQGMIVELEQSPFLSLVSDERIRHTLPLMGEPGDARLTPDVARKVCERIGSAAVIDGSIAPIGSQYVLSLHAANCHSGETLDDEQVQVARKEDTLNALTQIARKFRSRAGESLATIQQHATPLAEATTPSLDALKAYSAAWKIAFANPRDALLLLQRAIEIDHDFAMAYAFQGRLYADVWESALAEKSVRKAYELRNRASDRERFFIQQDYEGLVTGNVKRTQDTCEVWARTYPRDAAPHGELTWLYQELGEYDKSVEEAEKAIELDPDFTPGYNNLAWAYVLLDRLGDAEKTLQQASARNLDMPEMLVMRYYIAFLKGDRAGMQRAVAQGQGRFGAEDWLVYEQATILAYSGHLKQARRMADRATELARQANQPERAAMYQAGMAVREAFFGDSVEARQSAQAALKLSHGRDVEWGAALAFVLSGDFSQSQMLASDLERRFPEDTYVQLTYLPMLRALAALHKGDSAKALQLLQTAAPYDVGVPGSWSGFFGNLYPVYFRGMAYLAAPQGPEAAAAEFQKVLNHPAIVFSDPIGALAHLQMGRAYALAGDKANTRAAYQVFLALWKDADPDSPIFKQAKAEYAKMQ